MTLRGFSIDMSNYVSERGRRGNKVVASTFSCKGDVISPMPALHYVYVCRIVAEMLEANADDSKSER